MTRNRFGYGNVLLALWLFCAGSAVIAAAPLNDACSDAQIIPAAGPFPLLTTAFDISMATTTGDPLIGCEAEGGGAVSNSIWFRFTPEVTRIYTISAGTDSGSTVDDSVIVLYTSANGCAGPMDLFDCSEDEAGLQAALANVLQAGTTYYIVVSAGSLVDFSDGSIIQLRISTPAVTANDDCAGAEVIPGAGPFFPHLTTVTDTTMASVNSDPPADCLDVVSRSVWYRFTPDATSIYEFSTCTNTATSVFDNAIALFAAPNGCAGPLTAVACDDNGCGMKARLSATLQAGSTYFLVVWETLDEEPTLSETSVQVRVAKYTAPSVATRPASSVSSSGALLNAQVSPKGLPTTVWFEWGPTESYGMMTTPQTLGGTVSQANVARFISELTPEQTYHFRAVATNSLGSAVGADMSFRWSSAVPFIKLVKPFGQEAAVVFAGSPGQVYWVEASADLDSWNLIGNATDTGGGNYRFIDPLSDVLSQRFYRVASP